MYELRKSVIRSVTTCWSDQWVTRVALDTFTRFSDENCGNGQSEIPEKRRKKTKSEIFPKMYRKNTNGVLD